MGVGGHFWDLLKPHARFEGCNFLRNKTVAVDLSYWIVQQETAIKGYTRNPHIRLTFFRTINLFSKFGAYPVFVVDGTPSPLKSQARIVRFFRSSGIDLSNLPEAEEGVSVERNKAKCRRMYGELSLKDFILKTIFTETGISELLELLGMPVLKAKSEAEALCAELNREGHVDACITADSDAFLYGAQCVIKRIQPNSKEPFECYHISDIEAGLGLKRKHLIAVSLLVGNDHDLNGITGIGLDTAVRFVKNFSENEILERLHEIAREDPVILGNDDSVGKAVCSPAEKSPKPKCPHCSYCGHPGNKKAHLQLSCEYCNSTAGQSCWQKPVGFKCYCSSCDLDRKEKEKKKNKTWQITVCRKIASQQNFPNEEIIQMYLKQSRDCIQRVKIRYGHEFYVVNWKKAASVCTDVVCTIPEGSDTQQESAELDESLDLLEETDVPYIHIDSGGCFLSTDEDIELVQKAFPQKAGQFLKEKELKDMKKSQRKKSNVASERTPENSESSAASRNVQLSITEFYRSSKAVCPNKLEETAENSRGSSKTKRTDTSPRFSKSVRRRLLFG
ncbi:UNVERIFIED_CONTAM: Flap endonuclease GEN-like 1 [Sesamum calycinum]|uniref:Flap endonuclease GEN-like 1 n=1 Tax=Sesamum calycinum TaxID=2727403 RepID=A0AAW2SZM1_9LAMI